MKKMVKETIYEEWRPEFPEDTPADQGMRAARRDNYTDDNDILQQVKDHCEEVIAGAEEYFQSLEDEGMDPEDLDVDEVENYVSNESASNLAHQILAIINGK